MGFHFDSIQETAENRRMYILKNSIDKITDEIKKGNEEQRKTSEKRIKELEAKINHMEEIMKKDKKNKDFEMY